FDGQTAGDLSFLTKAIDALPFIDTKAKSDFTLRGEAAYMNPDPNTKKSTIADDNGTGIAYIDDFEGTKRIIPLGVNFGAWHESSPPFFQYNVDAFLTRPLLDTQKIKSKARTYWYNDLRQISVDDIYGFDSEGNRVKQVARGQDRVMFMTVNYNPLKRGMYNYSLDLQKTLLDNPAQNWGGIMKLLSVSSINMISENVGYIEIWVNVSKGRIDSTRKVYIDLGSISEDVHVNGRWDTEDQGNFKDDVVQQKEDTGIDGLFNNEESNQYAPFIAANKALFPEIEGDPSGDDYSYNTIDYLGTNGMELNRWGSTPSPAGYSPDTEDLNRNGNTDRANDYYTYELNLDTTDANPQRVGGGYRGWYQYRIPISEFKFKIGSPDQTNIQFARLWFTGQQEEFEMNFVEFNLIGNQWEQVKRNDSSFKVSVVNIEDNGLQGYTSPPGVFRERDRTKPDEQVYGNEQSLALNINALSDGDLREAIKKFSYKPLDVFSYREMKMFVHGDDHFSSDPAKPSVNMFIRFGSDSLNYYEYRAPVLPGWDSRNNVNIRFEDLTSLKQGRDSATARVTGPVPNSTVGAQYAVLGQPTLTRIAFISIGIENPVITATETAVTGQVWMNELRLANVDDTPGWAYSVSTSVRLADLGTVAFSYTRVDPNFHRLEDRLGSRVTSTSWNLSSAFSFEKFLPVDWTGTRLPFSYSHSEQISTPQYLPSSDILVTKAADQQRDVIQAKTGSAEKAEQQRDSVLSVVQTLTTTDTYSFPGFKITVLSDNWFFRDFFNRLEYGFSYTTSTLRNPNVASRTSWQWSSNLGYSYTFSTDNYIQPFGFFEELFLLGDFKDFQLYFNPFTNFSTSMTLSRSRTNERLRNLDRDSNPVRGLASSRRMAFGWKLTENGLLNLSGDYSLDISSTMVHMELDRFGRQRDFQQILNQMIGSDRLLNFGYDNSYSQSISVNTRPRIPADLAKYITFGARYQVAYRWANSLQNGDLGISTGWTNSISLSSDISLKAFVDSWFPAKPIASAAAPALPAPSRGRGDRDEDEDETEKKEPGTPAAESKPADTTQAAGPKGEGLIGIIRTVIKTPLLDYDKINVSFTQNNSANNGGVPGRPGFTNLFGRAPFVQQSENEYGPSRAYQLGLVSVPGANITDVFLKPAFPFIGFSTDAADQIRARGMRASDGFTQNNKLTFRTSRELWTGARMDLNWNLGWNYSRSQTIITDSITGRTTILNTVAGGSIERSFLTLPPTFIFSMFKSGIEQVKKKYEEYVPQETTPNQEQKLAQAFEEGFETLPILKKVFGDYLPRVNYSLRWDGLEEFGIFKSFATKVSLDHAYQSSYSKVFKGSADGNTVTESQRINYAFSPLAGMSVSFKELFKGTMSGNVRYGSTVTYDLTPSSKN
ncbi:MAG: cell surface protein SprA, partial [Bacteroidetes bacterium]|nr:cell surface protein SprA [Bacteroidota bacterium]